MGKIIHRTALIITFKNESDSLNKLLRSINNQTEFPDEIIFVDAFSNDGTYGKLLEFKKDVENRVKNIEVFLFKKRGNRSIGRNYAIGKANADLIAVTDGGVFLENNWFEKIISGFNDNSDVVAGFYKPITKNVFERSLSTYTCVMPDKLNNDFLPSSRSIAFKKNAWKKVGGYPEHLDTCEDLVFAKKLKEMGFKFKVQKSAIVYWNQRKNIWQAFRQFFSYAKGDGKASFIRKQTPYLYLRYIIGIGLLVFGIMNKNIFVISILILLFLLYILWAIYKNYKYVKNAKSFFWLPILQITSDVAVLLGMTIGFVTRKKSI